MNAAELLQAVNARRECAGLDDWISTTLLNEYRQYPAGTQRVIIDPSKVDWTFDDFQHAMSKRDFVVTKFCDDRPCSVMQYIIDMNLSQH